MSFSDPTSSDRLQREALDWLIRLTSGTATEQDAEALRQWRERSEAHERAFQAAARLWKSSGEAAFAQAKSERAAPSVVNRRAFLGGAVAASAAGVFVAGQHYGLWPTLAEWRSDVRTVAGQQRKIALPDGSMAELNTRTSLNLGFDNRARGVTLVSGEAAFAIKPDPEHPFVVTAQDGRITADGHEFVVRHAGADVIVTCLAGAVTVECDRRAVLRPSEQIAYRDGKLGAMAQINPELVTAWRRGVLVFRDEALTDIVDEINRYRAGRVIILRPALAQQRLSGVFHLDRIEEAISHVETTLTARAQHVAGGIVLIY